MAVEIFLTIDGIKGESQKRARKAEIEIFSFSNGASNPTRACVWHWIGGGQSRPLQHQSAEADWTSLRPSCSANCCSGAHAATGCMVVREATGDSTTQVYFQYDMTEVFIDSISWGGAAGGGKPSESVSMRIGQDRSWSPIRRRTPTGSLGDKIPRGLERQTTNAAM